MHIGTLDEKLKRAQKHSLRFQSPVILGAMAGHFQAIEHAPILGNARGALLLATAAVSDILCVAIPSSC